MTEAKLTAFLPARRLRVSDMPLFPLVAFEETVPIKIPSM